MRTRILTTILLLFSAPLEAEPLPGGSFVLGRHVFDDDMLTRYVALHVEGTRLELEFFWVDVLSFDQCDQENFCEREAVAATAEANVEAGRLTLSQIDIDPDVILSDDTRSPDVTQYTEPMIALLDGAAFEATGFGFELQQGNQTLPFFATTPQTRSAIQSYASTMEVSVRDLDGCEVSGLVGLFSNPDPTDRALAFRQVLLGFERRQDLQDEFRAVRRSADGEGDEEARTEARTLVFGLNLPFELAREESSDATAAIENLWEARYSSWLRGDRAAYDQAIAFFGDTLMPMVEYQRHLGRGDYNISAETACADLSFGFLTAE